MERGGIEYVFVKHSSCALPYEDHEVGVHKTEARYTTGRIRRCGCDPRHRRIISGRGVLIRRRCRLVRGRSVGCYLGRLSLGGTRVQSAVLVRRRASGRRRLGRDDVVMSVLRVVVRVLGMRVSVLRVVVPVVRHGDAVRMVHHRA